MEHNTQPVPLDPLSQESKENKRLWIGNLDLRLTEYQLLKILQKLGTIEKFDLLFHQSGPLQGRPRGYAFVTYQNKDDALNAKKELNGKVLGSKAVIIKWADYQLNVEKPKVIPNIPALAVVKKMPSVSRETQIQAIEAKLKLMETTSSSAQNFEIDLKPMHSTQTQIRKTEGTCSSRNMRGTYRNRRTGQKPYTRTRFK